MASPGYTYIEGGTLEIFLKSNEIQISRQIQLLKRKQTQKLSTSVQWHLKKAHVPETNCNVVFLTK